MTKSEKDIVKAVIIALNSIPTYGKDNLGKMFNCIDALNSIIAKEDGPDECNDSSDSGCSET